MTVPESSDRRAAGLAMIALVAIVTLLFADILFLGSNFYLRDLTAFYFPSKSLVREVISSGAFPSWNRFYSGGQPLAANPEFEIFYPPQWLILLPNFELGYRLHILLHIYLAAAGMFLFLRSMDLRPLTALVGGLCFGVGGPCLSLVNLLPMLFCFAWMPWIFLFARRYFLRPNRRDFCLAALFLGLQALIGEPATLLQTWLLIASYALYRAWHGTSPSRAAMFRNAGLAVLLVLVAFGIAAVQLIPAADHVFDSVRARKFTFTTVSEWSMPPIKPLELIFPHVLGQQPLLGDRYWGGMLYRSRSSPFIGSLYLGLLLAVAAIAGLLLRRRGYLYVMTLGFASYVLAIGEHGPLLRPLYETGVFGSLRFPEKFALCGIVTIAVWGALVFDQILRGDERLRRAALGSALVLTAGATLFALASHTSHYVSWFGDLWGLDTTIAGSAAAISRGDWWGAAMRCGVLSGLLLMNRGGAAAPPRAAGVNPAASPPGVPSPAARKGGYSQTLSKLRASRSSPRQRPSGAESRLAMASLRRFRLAPAAWLFFVIADLGFLGNELAPRMPARFFTAPDVLASFKQGRLDYRIFAQTEWHLASPTAGAYRREPQAEYWGMRNSLFHRSPASYGLQTIFEHDIDLTSLLPTEDLLQSMWEVKAAGRADWDDIFMAMSNVHYRTAYRPYEAEMRRIGGDIEEVRPIEFVPTPPYPRYYFADQMVTIRDRQDFVAKLAARSWSRRVAFVGFPAFSPAAGRVLSATETANTARIEVEAEGKSFWVASVTPHKYWRATVDGVETPLAVTNIGYQGLIVAAGKHVIEMRYANTLIPWAAAVSVLTLAGLAAVAIRAPPHRHRGPGPEE